MPFIINTLILVSNSKYIEDQNTNKESLIFYSIIRESESICEEGKNKMMGMVPEQNMEKHIEKQMGCMTGFLQPFFGSPCND